MICGGTFENTTDFDPGIGAAYFWATRQDENQFFFHLINLILCSRNRYDALKAKKDERFAIVTNRESGCH